MHRTHADPRRRSLGRWHRVTAIGSAASPMRQEPHACQLPATRLAKMGFQQFLVSRQFRRRAVRANAKGHHPPPDGSAVVHHRAGELRERGDERVGSREFADSWRIPGGEHIQHGPCLLGRQYCLNGQTKPSLQSRHVAWIGQHAELNFGIPIGRGGKTHATCRIRFVHPAGERTDPPPHRVPAATRKHADMHVARRHARHARGKSQQRLQVVPLTVRQSRRAMEKTGDADGRVFLQVLSDTGPRRQNPYAMLGEMCCPARCRCSSARRGLKRTCGQDHLPRGNGEGLAISRKPSRPGPARPRSPAHRAASR